MGGELGQDLPPCVCPRVCVCAHRVPERACECGMHAWCLPLAVPGWCHDVVGCHFAANPVLRNPETSCGWARCITAGDADPGAIKNEKNVEWSAGLNLAGGARCGWVYTY